LTLESQYAVDKLCAPFLSIYFRYVLLQSLCSKRGVYLQQYKKERGQTTGVHSFFSQGTLTGDLVENQK
jgi:hypothetical protein